MAQVAGAGKTMALNLVYHRRTHSPIALPPAWIRTAIRANEVALPPPSLMKSGGLELHDLVTLLGVARALHPTGSVLEIGTANGLTSLALARNLPQCQIYTLDLPTNVRPVLPVGQRDHPLARGDDVRVFADAPEAGRITQLLGDSATFDFSVIGVSCDLVFVDGSHSTEYVAWDTETALTLTRDEGAIVWDDYWYFAPDVVRYLDGRRDLQLYRLPATRLVVWFSEGALKRLGEYAVSRSKPA